MQQSVGKPKCWDSSKESHWTSSGGESSRAPWRRWRIKRPGQSQNQPGGGGDRIPAEAQEGEDASFGPLKEEGSYGGAEVERHVGPRLQVPDPFRSRLCADEEIGPFFHGMWAKNNLLSRFFFFLAIPHSTWYLSPPSRIEPKTSVVEHEVLTTGPPGTSQRVELEGGPGPGISLLIVTQGHIHTAKPLLSVGFSLCKKSVSLWVQIWNNLSQRLTQFSIFQRTGYSQSP